MVLPVFVLIDLPHSVHSTQSSQTLPSEFFNFKYIHTLLLFFFDVSDILQLPLVSPCASITSSSTSDSESLSGVREHLHAKNRYKR